jgi:hypothetical protein
VEVFVQGEPETPDGFWNGRMFRAEWKNYFLTQTDTFHVHENSY